MPPTTSATMAAMATEYVTRQKIDGNGMTAGERSGMIIGILGLFITLVGVGCTLLHLQRSPSNKDIGNSYALSSVGLTSVRDPRDPDRDSQLLFFRVQTVPPEPACPSPVARPDTRNPATRITEINETDSSDGRATDEGALPPPPPPECTTTVREPPHSVVDTITIPQPARQAS
ncbi:hypothetical protein EDC01DRAFT_631216 [Geopyxis carbonaria]|nr:hypothetical protein EDC01DRAFT_631216 [Geopyxis carbonaria]